MVTTIERLGTWDDVFGSVEADVLTIARTLRAAILDDMPNAVEVPRRGDRAVSYGIGERKMSESHCYLQPQRTRVNLGFWHGVALPDPHGILEGTGRRLRHVKVADGAMAGSDAVRALIAAAREERARVLGA